MDVISQENHEVTIKFRTSNELLNFLHFLKNNDQNFYYVITDIKDYTFFQLEKG